MCGPELGQCDYILLRPLRYLHVIDRNPLLPYDAGEDLPAYDRRLLTSEKAARVSGRVEDQHVPSCTRGQFLRSRCTLSFFGYALDRHCHGMPETLTSRRLSLAMRRAHSAQSESPIPDRQLYRKGVGSTTSSPTLESDSRRGWEPE